MPPQPGITGRQPPRLALATFDLRAPDRLRELLEALEAAAAAATGAHRTVLVGLGAGVFDDDRTGLGVARPTGLRPLPPFPGDALDPGWCGGDVLVHAAATDDDEAAAALGGVAAAVGDALAARWHARGFLGRLEGATPRNLLGFKDGSMNLRLPRELDRHVWVRGRDRTWMTGGTYLVHRRIRLDLPGWRRLPVERQEAVIGRRKATGAPFGGRREFDPRLLDRLPEDAHVRVAAPAANDRAAILRRSYDYADGDEA